jgi:hypothetical protein
MVSKDITGSKARRHGDRVVLSLDVEPHVRNAIRDRASQAGVSMAAYLTNALALPERSFDTAAAEIAQPLAILSYRIARAQSAFRANDAAALIRELDGAQRVVAEALRSLARDHSDEEAQRNRCRAGGWSG